MSDLDLGALRRFAEDAGGDPYARVADGEQTLALIDRIETLEAEVDRLRAELAEATAVLSDERRSANEEADRADRAEAALVRVTDDSMSEVIASHTPTLVGEGPNGEDDGQHLYCVTCGVLPIDGLGFQDGPGHVLAQIRAVAAGEQAEGVGRG